MTNEQPDSSFDYQEASALRHLLNAPGKLTDAKGSYANRWLIEVRDIATQFSALNGNEADIAECIRKETEETKKDIANS